MNPKDGTPQQRRATHFEKTPATGLSLCPFKSNDVAIVPMRYALDRSRYDIDCKTLKPLPASGRWARLPALQTRSYTLRQLYDGYVYVFDETANTLHEYQVSGGDSTLARIVWTDAHTGRDTRSGASEPKPYVLYPRAHRLHLGFSPRQWTWKLCEHMRSNADSRARWLKPLDLASYCATMAEPGTLPLSKMAEAVADVDPEQAEHDGRFDDSSVPTQNASLCSPAGADVYWLGSVPDKNSALLVALDDPLAVLTDLGLQLAADQAALRAWQTEHEHKVQMANVVTNLCASSDNPERLPAEVKNDVASTQQYLSEVDACLEQQFMEESEALASSTRGDALVTLGKKHSQEMKAALEARYGTALSSEDAESWSKRAKWRREVDIEGARSYIATHKPTGDSLARDVRRTQADFMTWAQHIGVDPQALFIDTTHPGSLLYLTIVMGDLLVILAQDVHTHGWLLEQEDTATSLFGTIRYGFSAGLKDALNKEADRLLNGLGDYTNLATRIGELNSVLNHPRVAASTWMKLLKHSVGETFGALGEVVIGEGKSAVEAILTAWLPVDSQRVKGMHNSMRALIRTLMIGQILLDSPHLLAIDAEVDNRLKNWKRERRVLEMKISGIQRQWNYPGSGGYNRHSLSRQLEKLEAALRLHDLQVPVLMDFQNQQYTRLMHHEARQFLESGLRFEEWKAKANDWMNRQLGHLAAGVTWGVIMINFISTAFLFADLTRDGDCTARDIVKVGYSLAYSGNLLMAVYVAAPWAVIQAAQPIALDGKTVSILERSASYWTKRGNPLWADAVRGFRAGMVIMGALGILGAALEFYDIGLDKESAKTQVEKDLMTVKMAAVAFMGLGSLLGLAAGFLPAGMLPAAALGLGLAATLLLVGAVYLLVTILLNQLKQDSIGLWLRRCYWSYSSENSYSMDAEGITAERRDFVEIALSPALVVKRTHFSTVSMMGGLGDRPALTQKQDGAWVQILFPNHLRGRSVDLNIISSERHWDSISVQKSAIPIADDFLNNGRYEKSSLFSVVSNERPSKTSNTPNSLYFPPIPPEHEEIVWHTWVPLTPSAGYIELQIWYPQDLMSKPESEGYVYQIELQPTANTSVDGLLLSTLGVKKLTRNAALRLEIPA